MIRLKEKLNNRELTVGSWITLAHPAIAEIMAKTEGYQKKGVYVWQRRPINKN